MIYFEKMPYSVELFYIKLKIDIKYIFIYLILPLFAYNESTIYSLATNISLFKNWFYTKL